MTTRVSKLAPKASRTVGKWLAVLWLAAGLVAAMSMKARAQCPRFYNAKRTEGLRYLIKAEGGIGLVGGDSGKATLQSGTGAGLVHLDTRLNLGAFTAGLSGTASFSSPSNFYVADVHLGYNGVTRGLASYKRILSRREVARYQIGRYRHRLIHTRYCREVQGVARHHQITVGPRFVFSAQGKGVGGHLTYRFLKLYTRSNMLFHFDVHAAYARLNAFEGIGEGEQVTNAFGGGVKAGYAWGILSSTVSVEYFAKAWLLNATIGFTFWGA